MDLILTNNINYLEKRDTIPLFTSKKNPIDNYQLLALSNFDVNSAEGIEKKYFNLKFKGKQTGIYNCHGFTFASKRTSINDSQEIRKILKDDEYIFVNKKDVMVGDIVLYVENNGNIAHSALVVQVEDAPFSIIVLSKWGRYKEVRHTLTECEDYQTCYHEYWRNNFGHKIV